MRTETMKKQMETLRRKNEIMEKALCASAGIYYSINITKGIIPGTMYQVIDEKMCSLNERIGFPNDCEYQDVVAYWGSRLSEDEQKAFFVYFDTGHLTASYESGVDHVSHRYWTKDSQGDPMLAEQHIVMYRDAVNDDLLAIAYVLDLTLHAQEKRLHEMLEAALTAAKRAEHAKTDFLFGMSHDIRTPMNAVIGFTDLLEKHLDDKELCRSYIEKIKTSNNFLLSLINNVLQMSRIESGKVELDESVVDMKSMIEALHSLLGMQAAEKDLTVEVFEQVQHLRFYCDKAKLQEIFLNILSNSIKYTPTGGKISVRITQLPSERPGYGLYRTVIEDTGIGMSEEFLPHLFDEFSREQTSTESGTHGTGLGMPITKKLVELMGGTIAVESTLGKGTKFTVTLPFRISEAAEVREEGCECDTSTFAGKRILLAEDNELNAEIATAILQDAGFVVDRASDGIICVDKVEKAEAEYYDLVLMDIQMPNMDGYKAATVIRRLPDQKKANIPIVAMTANAFAEDAQKAFDLGMNGHVAKPVEIDKLLCTIARLLHTENTAQ